MNKNDLIYSTIKIEAGLDDGTGFIIDLSLRPDVVALAITTNKHVVEKSDDIEFTLTIQKVDGSLFTRNFKVTNYKNKCIFHEQYDLCVISLDSIAETMVRDGEKIVAPHITINDVCDSRVLLDSDAITDVYVVGYPGGFIDETNNLPMAKKGVTATPLYSNFLGRKTFVVDAGVNKGNSGSPVYIRSSDGVYRLAGIVYLEKNTNVEAGFIDGGIRKEGYCVMPTGLGVAIKAEVLLELWNKIRFNW